LFAVIWLGWIVSWMLAALWSARTEKRITTWETSASRAAIVIGAILLFYAGRRASAEARLWHVGLAGGYALAALTLAGVAFAWWARIHLGKLWSSAVARKQDHRIIDTGPYALVRHPIYTGLIVAIVATALAQGAIAGCLGAALVAVGLWLKARAEERFLADELGEDVYGAYRRRVPMLLPFLPNR
jgi:protein-S-isoprenylcysteine O-methyltransferase Ste14